MYYFIIVLKVIVGLSILNVWLVNRNKHTQWRGGGANSMKEEFATYGLSENIMIAVGAVKCLLAVGLLISIVYEPAGFPIGYYSAIGMAVMMLGAIGMHIKIKDPAKRSLPAAIFLILSLVIAFL